MVNAGPGALPGDLKIQSEIGCVPGTGHTLVLFVLS